MSGELDGLVDAFITCVAPMDGTRSKALVEYLEHIPPRFRDLGYAGKTLPNGNRIVDGKVMSWVYKLKSMEREAPIFTYYRDLTMFNRPDLEKHQDHPHGSRTELLAHLRAQRPAHRDHPAEFRFLHQTHRKATARCRSRSSEGPSTSSGSRRRASSGSSAMPRRTTSLTGKRHSHLRISSTSR